MSENTTNWPLVWISAGLFVGFFAFTEVGRITTRETARYIKPRIPKAEKWPGFIGERAPRPTRAAAELPKSAILMLGIQKLNEKMFKCLPAEMGEGFTGYYNDKDLQKDLLEQANKCIREREVAAVIPRGTTDVGYSFEVNRDNPKETKINFKTGARGAVPVTTSLGMWAQYIADPRTLPISS